MMGLGFLVNCNFNFEHFVCFAYIWLLAEKSSYDS